MVATEKLSPPLPEQEADQRVFFNGLTYKDYEIMLTIRGERSVPRMSFLNGVLELIAPSWNHENLKTLIARLVEAYAEERDLDLNGYGSWTLKNALEERGLEPDECYALGTRKDIPDLAIEVIWTHGGMNKLEIYRSLKIPEVWYWRKEKIEVHLLQEGGAYEVALRSRLLPELDLALLTSFLDHESQTQAVRAYRARLRSS